MSNSGAPRPTFPRIRTQISKSLIMQEITASDPASYSVEVRVESIDKLKT